MSEKKTRTTRAPSYAEAYLCVVLVFGLVIGAMILGVPVQATMLFASVIATVFAYRLGYSWDVLEKAIAGKLGKFYENYCLAEQLYVKDDSMTVQKYIDSVAKTLGGKITIDSFVRYEKGEGLQKREDNLAEEVAKMTAGQ